jgi:hypothetical protein
VAPACHSKEELLDGLFYLALHPDDKQSTLKELT